MSPSATPWEALRNKNLSDTNVPSGLVPGTLLWALFLGILGASGKDQGGTWYGTSAKPERHFTKGMFGKP